MSKRNHKPRATGILFHQKPPGRLRPNIRDSLRVDYATSYVNSTHIMEMPDEMAHWFFNPVILDCRWQSDDTGLVLSPLAATASTHGCRTNRPANIGRRTCQSFRGSTPANRRAPQKSLHPPRLPARRIPTSVPATVDGMKNICVCGRIHPAVIRRCRKP